MDVISMWLGFVGVLAVVQSIQIPIEVCPAPGRPMGRCSFRPSKNGCESNSQCRPGFLCCLEGCGRQCKPALAIRIQSRSGFCPVPPSSALVSCPATMRNDCRMDTDCDGNMKCCFHPCGSRCTNSQPQSRQLKQGLCPVLEGPSTCLGSIVDKCDSDSECPDQLKCCFHPCGRTCLSLKRQTLLLKPGTCPMPHSVFCNMARRDHCSTDADCPDMGKCCGHPCGRTCVRITPVRGLEDSALRKYRELPIALR